MKPSEQEKIRIFKNPVVNSLNRLNCRKVSVSPLGEVYPAND